jgi:hypothetical protein
MLLVEAALIFRTIPGKRLRETAAKFTAPAVSNLSKNLC